MNKRTTNFRRVTKSSTPAQVRKYCVTFFQSSTERATLSRMGELKTNWKIITYQYCIPRYEPYSTALQVWKEARRSPVSWQIREVDAIPTTALTHSTAAQVGLPSLSRRVGTAPGLILRPLRIPTCVPNPLRTPQSLRCRAKSFRCIARSFM